MNWTSSIAKPAHKAPRLSCFCMDFRLRPHVPESDPAPCHIIPRGGARLSRFRPKQYAQSSRFRLHFREPDQRGGTVGREARPHQLLALRYGLRGAGGLPPGGDKEGQVKYLKGVFYGDPFYHYIVNVCCVII